jgi:two-component system response regulator AtoC
VGGGSTTFTPRIPDNGTDLDKEMERFEAAIIKTALDKSGGVKSKAAELLNLKRTTLIEKMKRLKINA